MIGALAMSARIGLRAQRRSGYNSYMKKATIAHLKNNLSRYLAYVRRGGRITIFNRDTPIAELIPARAASSQDAGAIGEHLQRLEREGVLRRGSGNVPEALLRPPRGRSARVLDALLDERATGR